MTSTIIDRLNGYTGNVAVKAPVRVTTTGPINLYGIQTIDSVPGAIRDRVLVKDQVDARENGIWIMAPGDWIRAPDFDGALDAVGGTYIPVQAGNAYGNSYWRVAGSGAVAIGTDEIEIEPSSGNIDLQAQLAAGTGAELVKFLQAGDGADPRTIQAELRALSIRPDQFVGGEGNGVDNNLTATRHALDRLDARGGGILKLTPGNIYLWDGQFDFPDNIIFWMYGATIRVGTSFAAINKPMMKNFTGDSFVDPGTVTASENIALYGGLFDGESLGIANQLIPNSQMRGAIFCAGGWDESTGITNLKVRDVRMKRFAGAGIMGWHCAEVDIQDSHALNFFANETLSIGSAFDFHACDDVTFENNRMKHTAAGRSWHGAVFLDWGDIPCSDLDVHHNRVRGMNYGDGISCEGNGGAGSNVRDGRFNFNTIYDCAGQAIGLDNCYSVKAYHNTLRRCAGPGILGNGTPYFDTGFNEVSQMHLGGITHRGGIVRGSSIGDIVDDIEFTDSNYRGHGIEIVGDGAARVNIALAQAGNTDGVGVWSGGFMGIVGLNAIHNAGRSDDNTDPLRSSIIAGGNGLFVIGNRWEAGAGTTYALHPLSSDLPDLEANRPVGDFNTAVYRIDRRSTGIGHNFDIDIEHMRYEVRTNIMEGRYDGAPAVGSFYLGDTFIDLTPTAGGFWGSELITYPLTFKTIAPITA